MLEFMSNVYYGRGGSGKGRGICLICFWKRFLSFNGFKFFFLRVECGFFGFKGFLGEFSFFVLRFGIVSCMGFIGWFGIFVYF